MDKEVKKIAEYMGQTNPIAIEVLESTWCTFSKEILDKDWAPVEDITLKAYAEWLKRESEIWR